MKAPILILAAVVLVAGFAALPAFAQQTPSLPAPIEPGARPPAPVADNLANTLGKTSDADIWRRVRRGNSGRVSLPEPGVGLMIQSEGDNWRAIRTGPLVHWGFWFLAIVTGLIAAFFCLRGRIRIDSGFSGRTVVRFTALERFVHWLTAGSFIVLALTGLNLLYGRYLFALAPVGDGGDFSLLHRVFAAMTYYGKLAHNFIAFAFMAGLVLSFLIWVRHNIPNRHDVIWLLKGGGMFGVGGHPPAKKFNAGEKILFWLVILGGLSLSLSGIALLFPYQFSFFGGTFELVNRLGLDLPTQITPIEEMQLNELWHAVVALALIAVIIGHIYIGTLGMEGAFDAMYSGRVDENWAREHHDLWVAETLEDGAGRQPAE